MKGSKSLAETASANHSTKGKDERKEEEVLSSRFKSYCLCKTAEKMGYERIIGKEK